MRRYLLALVLVVFSILSFFFPQSPVHAQQDAEPYLMVEHKEEKLEGEVARIVEEKQSTPKGATAPQLYQKLEILITKGSLKGNTITIENGNMPMSNIPKYGVHDELMITYTKDFEGNDLFYISDYIRRNSLFWLFLLFLGLASM